MIIDTAETVTANIQHLVADNVTSVIRYLTTSINSTKLIKLPEAQALSAAGIRLGLVFEVYGGADGHNDIDAPDGQIDGQFCLQYAPTIGATNTACIFFAIDFDATVNQVEDSVLPYLTDAQEALDDQFWLGVYGSGAVCQAAIANKVADLAWLSGSMGWRGSRAYLAAKPKELVLVQTQIDVTLANMNVDINEALGDFGDLLPAAA